MALLPCGAIARRAAADALKNIGVTETGNNDGKWIRVYQQSPDGTTRDGRRGDPWCAFFTNFRQKAADAAIEPIAATAPTTKTGV